MKRTSMKAGVLVAALTALLTLGAAAASAQQKAPIVTLTAQWTSEQRLGWDIMVKNFQAANPNIKIETTYTPLANHPVLLQTRIQANDAPDLFLVAGGNQNP